MRGALEARPQRGEHGRRRAARREAHIGHLAGLVGEPIQRVPVGAGRQLAVHLLVEIGKGRHLGDVAALLVGAVAIDRHQIGDADAVTGLDEGRVAAAKGRDAGRVELHLVALHRQKHVVAAAIADDHAMLHAEHL